MSKLLPSFSLPKTKSVSGSGNSGNSGSSSVLKRVYKNSLLNVLTQAFVVVVTFFAIPHILKGLGDTAFGILSLVLIFIGYFSLVDFGLGSAVVKFVADKRSVDDRSSLNAVFTFSCIMSIVIGLIVGLSIFLFSKDLAHLIFKVSGGMDVIVACLRIVAATMPFMILQSILKGALMGYERFDTSNLIQAASGVLQWGGILFLVFFGVKLTWIIGYVALLRFGITVLYLFSVLRVSGLRFSISGLHSSLMKGMLGFGGWVMVSQSISPILQYLERFVLSATIATSILPFYVIPFDATSKLLVLATAIAAALFPGLSGISEPGASRGEFKRVYLTTLKMLAYVMIPTGIILATFAQEILKLWIGESFAVRALPCFQILILAFVVNSIAHIPYTTLHALGKPKIPGIFHLIELPIHIFVVFLSIRMWGVVGAAFATIIRMVLDAILLFWANQKELNLLEMLKGTFKTGIVVPAVAALVWAGSAVFLTRSVAAEVVVTLIGLSLYSTIVLRISLNKREREAIWGSIVRRI